MSFKKIFSNNKFIYYGVGLFFLILTLSVLLLPIEFSEYRTSDRLAPIWYLITETGSVYVAMAVVITIFIYLRVHYKKHPEKFRYIYLFVVLIILIQVSMTTISQFYFKDLFRHQRPSHLYLEEKGLIQNDGQAFFTMPMEEKRQYLRQSTVDNKDSARHVYPPILDSWIYESGYSFPSGHSQTSFFLGIIIGFIIYKKSVNKFNSLIPVLWAFLVSISRVVIGFHFPIDVIAGAAMGMTAGLIMISLGWVNKIFDS